MPPIRGLLRSCRLMFCSNESGHVKYVSVVLPATARMIGPVPWCAIALSVRGAFATHHRVLATLCAGPCGTSREAFPHPSESDHVENERITTEDPFSRGDPSKMNRWSGEEDGMAKTRKNPHAVALGRLGGKKGGPARAAKMTPEQRSESARKAGQASGKVRLLSLTAKQRSAIARKAALARWGK